MLEFKVAGMSCGHCVGRVKDAVKRVDAAAAVNVDLAAGLVSIDSAQPSEPFAAALVDAGYPPH